MKRDAGLIAVVAVLFVAFVGYWFSNLIPLTSTGVVAGLGLTVVALAIHYSAGTGWEPAADISQEVLEHRAAALPETDFPEPMNRSIGGGAAPAVGAGAEGELAEAEEAAEEEGFDPAAIPDDEVETYEIRFENEGETVEVASNETLLDAGEDEGWDLPYACREGQCLSCSGHIAEGEADEFIRHSQNDTLNQDEMSQGYCLTCVAYPTTDFTLETSESP